MTNHTFSDLHIHSNASDGTKTPSELILEAVSFMEKKQAESVTIALTDHDTVSGVDEFIEAAKPYEGKIHAIPGVEISAEFEGTEIHMLGLGIDHHNEELVQTLARYRESRDGRNDRMVEKFQKAGFDITMEEIIADHPGESIARPEIARKLMEKGYVSTIAEAFERYIGDGKPFFIVREKPSMEEAVRMILEAGGKPVLAHMMLYRRLDKEKKEKLVKELAEVGLVGLETYYSEYSKEDTAFVESLADRYHLVKTTGSDYHGDNKPHIQMFFGMGNLC